MTLGAQVMEVFADPMVNEVYVNPGLRGEPMHLWSDGRRGKERTSVTVDENVVEQFLSIMATSRGETLTTTSPHLQAKLPSGEPFHGARLQGIIAPVTSQATFVIRKHSTAIFTLDSYVESGTMTAAQREALAVAVREHENIVIAGGTSSGKTTLTNAVLQEIAERTPDDRIVVLEDTPELQCTAEDALHMTTSPEADMKTLVYLTLRCTPNRIVVGEVRDEAAYDLLDAWSTGHPGGVCTVHAESPKVALARLHRLASKGSEASRHQLLGNAIGLIVVVQKVGGVRRVTHFVRVHGWDAESGYDIEPVGGEPDGDDPTGGEDAGARATQEPHHFQGDGSAGPPPTYPHAREATAS
jgi:type IV secretion system protein VirB11